MYLNETNFTDYASARKLVIEYIEQRTLDLPSGNANEQGPTPMDLDPLQYQWGKGKGSGKEKGSKG
eukprot:5383847-Amphidinium_carterae.2